MTPAPMETAASTIIHATVTTWIRTPARTAATRGSELVAREDIVPSHSPLFSSDEPLSFEDSLNFAIDC